jgi:hypothetical protein
MRIIIIKVTGGLRPPVTFQIILCYHYVLLLRLFAALCTCYDVCDAKPPPRPFISSQHKKSFMNVLAGIKYFSPSPKNVFPLFLFSLLVTLS